MCFALQAYTSQFVALIMFALLMCDDRISMQPRRREIIQGLRVLPGKSSHEPCGSAREILITCEIKMYRDGKPALRAKIKYIQGLFHFCCLFKQSSWKRKLSDESEIRRREIRGRVAVGCRPSHASLDLKHMMPWHVP